MRFAGMACEAREIPVIIRTVDPLKGFNTVSR